MEDRHRGRVIFFKNMDWRKNGPDWRNKLNFGEIFILIGEITKASLKIHDLK
jgi:hypothetical protein